jgi:NAD-dependent SIR2 family protein deacetylase
MREQTSTDMADLRELVGRGDVLVLSGAGMSTDSGIPDYRGPSGRRRQTAPMTFADFRESPAARQRYWARSHLGWELIARAKPNAGHHAVTALQQAGLLAGVVTQNVDGLHTVAGTRGVIDLHGRLDAVVCLGCGLQRPRVEIALRLDAVNPGFRLAVSEADSAVRPDGDLHLPDDIVADFRTVDCRRCGGVLKPGVVFFGEPVPRARFQRALGLLEDADALLVLGSSLTVGSGFRFVVGARRSTLPVAIVNQGATRGDRYATVKVDARLAEVLPTLARTCLGSSAGPRTV